MGPTDADAVAFRRLKGKEKRVAFRQNYGLQRAERNRLRQAKKEAKDQERRDVALRRKSGRENDIPIDTETPGTADADTSVFSRETAK